MPIAIVLQSKGLSVESFQSQISKISENVRSEINRVASAGRDAMRNVIDSSRKRPKTNRSKNTGASDGPRTSANNNLANTIKKEEVLFTEERIEVGVGKIKELDERAPYWAIINYGGNIKSGAVPGLFDGGPPQKGGGGQDFKYTKIANGGRFMNPAKPIEPKNYIQRANDVVSREINNLKVFK